MTGAPVARQYGRDWRWTAAVFLTVIGAAVFVGTWLLSGDGWKALVVNAGYTVGGALLTFAVLYLVSSNSQDLWIEIF